MQSDFYNIQKHIVHDLYDALTWKSSLMFLSNILHFGHLKSGFKAFKVSHGKTVHMYAKELVRNYATCHQED